MSTVFTSPEGRFVQGSMTLQPKKDEKGKPVLDAQGVPVQEAFIALAVKKDNPELNAFYALYLQTARAAFPSMFDANGQLVNPNFAMKIQDGDGRDNSGKSVADKPGFAGCWIFKFATRFAPTCYARDSNQNLVQLTDPNIIKKGYRIRVNGTLDGNGVTPGGAAKCGLYASPNMVLFVAPDEEIASGGNPNEAFGNLPSQAGLAASGFVVPAGGTLPGLGGGAPALGGPALGALPGIGAGPSLGAMPQGGGIGAMPGAGIGAMPGAVAPAGPQYTPTALMQGATLEWALGPEGNWTIEALLARGMVTKNY